MTVYSAPPTAILVTEFVNRPSTPDGNMVTLRVTVTPPADPSYAYSLIAYGEDADALAIHPEPANDSVDIVVPGDGRTLRLMALPVTNGGRRAPASPCFTDHTVSRFDVDNAPVVAPVTGLEVVGSAVNEVVLAWRYTTAIDDDIGRTGKDPHVVDWLVEVEVSGEVVRAVPCASPWFAYTLDMNLADNGSFATALRFRVTQRGRLNGVGRPAVIDVTAVDGRPASRLVPRTVTASTTASVWEMIDADATAGVITIYMPPPAAVIGGVVVVSKVDATANYVVLSGLINGEPTQTMTLQHTTLTLVSKGSEWRIS